MSTEANTTATTASTLTPDAELADHEARITALEIKAGLRQPPPPPPPVLPTFDAVSNYGTNLTIGEVVIATARLAGVPLTLGVTWTLPATTTAIKAVAEPGNKSRVTGLAAGSATLTAQFTDGAGNVRSCALAFTVQGPTAQPAPTPTPVPTPTPAPTPSPVVVPPTTITRMAPAALWARIRDHLCELSTDFYYTWTTIRETICAWRYDVFISGDRARHARMKVTNPNSRYLPYVLLNTVQQPVAGYKTNTDGTKTWVDDLTPSLSGAWTADFAAWGFARGGSAAELEACFLKVPGGTLDLAGRASIVVWDSHRWVPDPRNAMMRLYQLDRFKRLAADALVDGLFVDEFDSGEIVRNYKLAAGTDATMLAALCDAQTSLVTAIADAMVPKQLIVNTASYAAALDVANAQAARGVHLEQTNNPLVVEMWAQWWPYIDKLLAAGVFVNFVPPYQFGEYESQHDAQPIVTAMDTPRGKLLELASAYMVTTDPALLALSIENGGWAKFTPDQNTVPEADWKIGRAMEPRVRRTELSGAVFTRRFANGLVVVNATPNRNPPNYGDTGALTFTLPTDRAYRRVLHDGTLAPASPTVTLRTPEAAIFAVTP